LASEDEETKENGGKFRGLHLRMKNVCRVPSRRQFQSKSINPFHDMKERVESPPLWVWAVIVGAIIVAKFTLRWSRLKRLARELRKR
jgi:hypothetical protein